MAAFFVSLIQTAGEFLIYAAIALAGILLGKNTGQKKINSNQEAEIPCRNMV